MILLILIKHSNLLNSYIKKLKINKINDNNIKKANKNNENNKINNWIHKDKSGQLSLEFILISLVSLLIFISITLPLIDIALDSTLDTTNSIETKAEILKITTAIDDVYSDGIGSRRVVYIEVPQDITLSFFNNASSNSGIASGNINLNKNKDNKSIEVLFKADNIEGTLNLKKKVITKVIIEWPNSNDKIIVKI